MTDSTPGDAMAAERQAMIRHLQELIAALDMRTPHLERCGEVDIAREAASLKEKALARLSELGA